MKKKFSIKWKSSKQKRKQRKYRFNAPLHIRKKLISANLSKELRKKYNRRSFPLRKGDLVKIMRGSFKGKSGKIEKINLKKLKVSIEGIQKQKKDGTKINIWFDPSKLQIIELNLEDKKRLKKLEDKNAQKKTINA
ncbi:MAG: 50S ribosomal protein L24 [Candidatus Pacearchaeota archaeon]